MKKFICLKCKSIWYSSAPLKYQYNKNCDSCGGELRELEDKEYLLEIKERNDLDGDTRNC